MRTFSLLGSAGLISLGMHDLFMDLVELSCMSTLINLRSGVSQIWSSYLCSLSTGVPLEHCKIQCCLLDVSCSVTVKALFLLQTYQDSLK
jgi:hypothetical protein